MVLHSSRQTINYSAPLTPNKGHLVYLSETAAMQAKARKWDSEIVRRRLEDAGC